MLFYCILHPTATRAVKMQSYKSYSVYSLFINNNFSPAAATPHSSPIRTPFSRRPHPFPSLQLRHPPTTRLAHHQTIYASMVKKSLIRGE